MDAEYTAEGACAKIYSTYGENLCVSAIIKKMQADNKNGGHPNLRVGNGV